MCVCVCVCVCVIIALGCFSSLGTVISLTTDQLEPDHAAECTVYVNNKQVYTFTW